MKYPVSISPTRWPSLPPPTAPRTLHFHCKDVRERYALLQGAEKSESECMKPFSGCGAVPEIDHRTFNARALHPKSQVC